VAVGMEAAITRRDAIITAYRDHCLYLAHGGSLVAASTGQEDSARACSGRP
jgi:pyruvate dehydrogenase E1 component alpha subunit